MSDEVDIANDFMEMSRMAAIEACRHHVGIVPKGSCWFCDESLPKGQKFCDRDCAEDYEMEQAAMMRNGQRHYVDVHAD